MTTELLKKSYLAAALSAAGIIGAILLYAVVGEILARSGLRPPLLPPAAYVVKYAVYILSIASVFAVRFAAARLDVRRATPEAALKALTARAIITAALCEVPAVAGLILFLLTGYKADFYLLLAFSAGLEVYHFPRLARWEEKLRTDYGQLT
ncbi:MAG: hypothetical protein AB7V08_09670 [Elusimicrobiales bacterium]